MRTPMSQSILAVALAVIATVGLAACSGATQQPEAPSAMPSKEPSPSVPPAASTDPGSTAGGGSAGDPGTGAGTDPSPGPFPGDPIDGPAQIVQPLPGRINPHPVAPIKLEASVDGPHVLVKVTWYGGVAPCSVLDSVTVTRSGNDIAITPFEGASNVNVACIDIALLKATIVDLGDVDPGTWRISSPGSDAAAIEVTIT
jgi:hypothetical protein